MLTSRNTTTTILGVIIAAGLIVIGGGAATIAPLSAFALSSHTSTHIDAPVFQSNDQTSSPRTMATIKTTQINSPSSDIGAGLGKNSFGVGVSNQNNSQDSTARTNQDVSITEDAANANLQSFSTTTISTMFCIFDHKGDC